MITITLNDEEVEMLISNVNYNYPVMAGFERKIVDTIKDKIKNAKENR